MKRIQNAPLQLFFLLLLLFSFTAMACQLGSALEATPTPRAREEEPEAEPEPTEEPPTVAAPTPEPEEPEVEEPIVPEEVIAPIERLQAATVQIFAKQVTNGRLQTIWTGSGTILSPDGVILTNAHVAAPSAPGLATLYNDPELLFGEEPDQLVVASSDSADRPHRTVHRRTGRRRWLAGPRRHQNHRRSGRQSAGHRYAQSAFCGDWRCQQHPPGR